MRSDPRGRFIEFLKENIDAITGITREKSRPSFWRTKLLGNFKKPGLAAPKLTPVSLNQARRKASGRGQKVLHLKFGEGEVMHIDERNVPLSIFLKPQIPKKKNCLQFAKLQILE